MIRAYDIRIYGHVFNVGFRRYVHRYGLQCNVKGYVENDYADDCVHIVAEGEATDLDRFTLLCGEGTTYSHITDKKIEAMAVTGKFDEFQEIR